MHKRKEMKLQEEQDVVRYFQEKPSLLLYDLLEKKHDIAEYN